MDSVGIGACLFQFAIERFCNIRRDLAKLLHSVIMTSVSLNPQYATRVKLLTSFTMAQRNADCLSFRYDRKSGSHSSFPHFLPLKVSRTLTK